METYQRQPQTLVALLRKIIKETGMPQYELAKIIGCPASTLNRWLRGQFPPSLAWQRNIDANEKLKGLISK